MSLLLLCEERPGAWRAADQQSGNVTADQLECQWALSADKQSFPASAGLAWEM